jgi:hypothetical protein
LKHIEVVVQKKVTLEETTRGWTERKATAAVLGILDLSTVLNSSSSGTISVYGDSNCMDSAQLVEPNCFELIDTLIKFGRRKNDADVQRLLAEMEMLQSPFEEKFSRSPFRKTDSKLDAYSRTLADGAFPKCGSQIEEEVHLNSSVHVSRQRRKRNRKINVRPPVDFLPLENFTENSTFTSKFIFHLHH